MLRRIIAAIVAGILAGGFYVWWTFGPVNVPFLPPPRDSWEALLRERIKVPVGYAFSVFARDLGRPRLMQLTASGDVIISGHRGGNILLVKADADGDGRSDRTAVLKERLNQPHGLVLEGERLIVAEEHRVVSYRFDGAALSDERVLLAGLPTGGSHSSRTVKRGPDGYLYVSIGSTCNACIEDHPWRAAIIRFREGEAATLYASGLRNTVGFDWHPETGALYGVDNGRDQMGDDVPDDEVNLITAGGHYGWPYHHGRDVKDPSLGDAGPPGVALLPMAHGLGAHVAPLAITFLKSVPGAALVAEHGSWNRSEKSGYRVVRLDFGGESIREQVFLEGCVMNEEVICRPVDVLEAPDGAIYVSDDYAGAVYRIARTP
jgi:glucose/arabinose dehydrogenase